MPIINPEIADTLATCKQVLIAHYGDRLQSLILFGSAARQALSPDSDLDLLVVLKPPFDYFQELRSLVDILSDFSRHLRVEAGCGVWGVGCRFLIFSC